MGMEQMQMGHTKFKGYNDKTYVLNSSGQCALYFLITFCILFIMASLASIAIVIWLLFEADFLEVVASSLLFTAAIALWIAAGAVLLVTAIIGLVGSGKRSKKVLGLFVILMAVLILSLVVVGVLAFIFRGELDEQARGDMLNMLKNQYGLRDSTPRTRAVTESWDRVQIYLDCCGVDDKGFGVYRESKWFAEQPGNIEARKPFVPQSCCSQNQFGEFIDKDECQLKKDGPPGQNSGSNYALNVRGCYEASKQYVKERTDIIAGFGFSLAIALIMGLICAAVLFVNIKRQT